MTKQARFILTLVPLACAAMAFAEGVLSPAYPVKTALRIALFAGSFLIYRLRFRDQTALFAPASLKSALVLGAGAFFVLQGGFGLLLPYLDPDAILSGLTSGENITRENFPLVALYICTVNSFLEELFFRGFAYLILRRHWRETPARWFSAAVFALYHVSILSGWFPVWLFALILAGLLVCGLLFNHLDRHGSLYPSWLLHASANAAINLIGLMLFASG